MSYDIHPAVINGGEVMQGIYFWQNPDPVATILAFLTVAIVIWWLYQIVRGHSISGLYVDESGSQHKISSNGFSTDVDGKPVNLHDQSFSGPTNGIFDVGYNSLKVFGELGDKVQFWKRVRM
jgi:hypothetical protein